MSQVPRSQVLTFNRSFYTVYPDFSTSLSNRSGTFRGSDNGGHVSLQVTLSLSHPGGRGGYWFRGRDGDDDKWTDKCSLVSFCQCSLFEGIISVYIRCCWRFTPSSRRQTSSLNLATCVWKKRLLYFPPCSSAFWRIPWKRVQGDCQSMAFALTSTCTWNNVDKRCYHMLGFIQALQKARVDKCAQHQCHSQKSEADSV